MWISKVEPGDILGVVGNNLAVKTITTVMKEPVCRLMCVENNPQDETIVCRGVLAQSASLHVEVPYRFAQFLVPPVSTVGREMIFTVRPTGDHVYHTNAQKWPMQVRVVGRPVFEGGKFRQFYLPHPTLALHHPDDIAKQKELHLDIAYDFLTFHYVRDHEAEKEYENELRVRQQEEKKKFENPAFGAW